MVYKEQYDMLIKEYCDIYDDETRQYLLSIDEAEQNQVLLSLTSKLYQSIVDKVDDIDFGKIPLSKGDITKVENYDQLKECCEVIKNILIQYKQDTTTIDTITDAMKNIEVRKEIFEKGFRYEVEMIMIIYCTMVLSVISSISFLISSCIEYIKVPNADNFQLSVDKVALQRTNANLLFTNLKKFNKTCKDGTMDKSLDYILKQNMKQFTGLAVVSATVALVVITLNIIPVIRELIFFFYYTRTRIADYFEIQSEVLKINAYNLENNQYDTKHTKTEKKQIAAKQNKIAEVLKNIANKFAIKYKKSEAETNKEISKDKDMKLKLKDLKETNPETTSSSSSTSLF